MRAVHGWMLCGLSLLVGPAVSQERVQLTTEDGGSVVADLYPGGARAVVLAHGGRFNRQGWKPQAELLSRAGYRVLAVDFRGFGESRGPGTADLYTAPLHLDLLAAVRYLREQGAKSVSIVGGSLGGMAAGDALLAGKAGGIDRVVFLGSPATLSNADTSKMPGRKLFIVARDDRYADGKPRLERIQSDYEKVPPPRELLVVAGSAHAQALFDTAQSAEVLNAMLRFLGEE